ncbi:MAG: hypothetical protein MZV64_09750 [Ignavibacteriales bacterium]|nr:hypothetical protein [Ignavibacteriales bacterium]
MPQSMVGPVSDRITMRRTLSGISSANTPASRKMTNPPRKTLRRTPASRAAEA